MKSSINNHASESESNHQHDYKPNSHDNGVNDNNTDRDEHYNMVMAPSLRVLCLHDGHSNAGELSDQLEVLGERLYDKHKIDLVYVNAPLLAAQEASSTERKKHRDRDGNVNSASSRLPIQHPLDKDSQRVWWEVDQGDENDEAAKSIHSWKESETLQSEKKSFLTQVQHEDSLKSRKFVGLDASLLLLRQIWSSMPFWGVLAVGKGAAVASFLPLLPVSPEPQFMIFIQGETILEETELLVDSALSNACLHVMESEVGTSSQSSSARLLRQFGGHVVTGSTRQFSTKLMNVIGKFLINQKKSLRTTNADVGNVLVLQNQLYMVEQEAANAVAQRIALDPPKALMAVISPQKVGGWNGGRRRAPNEEGGGAPCPSEFLLQREKRSRDVTGPTREHPESEQRQLETKH